MSTVQFKERSGNDLVFSVNTPCLDSSGVFEYDVYILTAAGNRVISRRQTWTRTHGIQKFEITDVDVMSDNEELVRVLITKETTDCFEDIFGDLKKSLEEEDHKTIEIVDLNDAMLERLLPKIHARLGNPPARVLVDSAIYGAEAKYDDKITRGWRSSVTTERFILINSTDQERSWLEKKRVVTREVGASAEFTQRISTTNKGTNSLKLDYAGLGIAAGKEVAQSADITNSNKFSWQEREERTYEFGDIKTPAHTMLQVTLTTEVRTDSQAVDALILVDGHWNVELNGFKIFPLNEWLSKEERTLHIKGRMYNVSASEGKLTFEQSPLDPKMSTFASLVK